MWNKINKSVYVSTLTLLQVLVFFYTDFVTNLSDNCDRIFSKRLRKYPVFGVLLILLLSCGSKKKTVEVNKSTYKENKDLSVFQQNDILSSIFLNKLDTQIVFEPINTAIPIKINDSTSISNARVVISVKKTDSTVINRDSSTVKVKDKGEVYGSTKSKAMEKEKEPEFKINIWAVLFVVVIAFVIGKWKKWF